MTGLLGTGKSIWIDFLAYVSPFYIFIRFHLTGKILVKRSHSLRLCQPSWPCHTAMCREERAKVLSYTGNILKNLPDLAICNLCFFRRTHFNTFGNVRNVSVPTENMFSLKEVKKEITKQTKKEMTICYSSVPDSHYSDLMQRWMIH